MLWCLRRSAERTVPMKNHEVGQRVVAPGPTSRFRQLPMVLVHPLNALEDPIESVGVTDFQTPVGPKWFGRRLEECYWHNGRTAKEYGDI